jgi:hypothetical protein
MNDPNSHRMFYQVRSTFTLPEGFCYGYARSVPKPGDWVLVPMPRIIWIEHGGFMISWVARTVPTGTVVFVPDGLKAGDRMVLVWIAPTCALAEKVV